MGDNAKLLTHLFVFSVLGVAFLLGCHEVRVSLQRGHPKLALAAAVGTLLILFCGLAWALVSWPI